MTWLLKSRLRGLLFSCARAIRKACAPAAAGPFIIKKKSELEVPKNPSSASSTRT